MVALVVIVVESVIYFSSFQMAHAIYRERSSSPIISEQSCLLRLEIEDVACTVVRLNRVVALR